MSDVATATRTAEHTISVDAPPAVVFSLVADVGSWPHIFDPTVHAEVSEEGGGAQRLRIWSLADGKVYSWMSKRLLDERNCVATFRQVITAAPVEAMGGEWRIEPVDGGASRVVLLHDYRAIGDDPEALDLIERAVDRNSRAELMALRNAAELGSARDELQYTFSDSVHVDGSADDVYAFLYRADLWAERLTHVVRAELSEEVRGVQHLEMETRGVDGSVHPTRSVRVCFEDRRVIVYKQLRMPIALKSHTGRWVVEAEGPEPGAGVRATSWHTVTLDPEGVRQAIGARATIPQARDLVQQALSANSRNTLRLAREYAEGRRG